MPANLNFLHLKTSSTAQALRHNMLFPNNQTPSQRLPAANQTPSISHSAQKHTMALRGAEGDRRAQRGSSRSKSRAALVEWWNMESPQGLTRGSGEVRQAQRGRPGGVQRGPRLKDCVWQPLTGPHLPPPEAAQTKKEKSPCTRRVQKSPFNGQAMQRKFRLPAGGGPNYINEKPLCPQGAENTSRRPNSALFALKP